MSDELRPEDFPAGVPSEPVDARDAFAMRERMRADPGGTAVLLPTLRDFRRDDPEEHLQLVRLVIEGVREALGKAIQWDRDQPGSRSLAGTGVALENALVEVYGAEPRLLARFLVQHLLEDAVASATEAD